MTSEAELQFMGLLAELHALEESDTHGNLASIGMLQLRRTEILQEILRLVAAKLGSVQ